MKLDAEFFIARRIISDRKEGNKISRPVVGIAIIGIALGLAAMIISTATVTGFKNEIRDKVTGFGSHIQIQNFDSNTSFETAPIDKLIVEHTRLDSIEGIKHCQVYATKAGIIKTESEIQGTVLKGVDNDFDWTFFEENLIKGSSFRIVDSIKTNKVLISKYTSDLLQLHAEDDFLMYFVQDPPRWRKFTVSGIYETNLEEFDKLFILADIKHIQQLNKWGKNEVSGVELTIDEFSEIERLTEDVRDAVGYQLSETGKMLKVTSIIQKHPQIFDWLNLQNMNVIIILALIFLVAGFNMVSSLLILILERTNMIGILKAVGTSSLNIKKIFLYQSAFLISYGLFWGNLIGLGLALLQKQFGLIKLDQESYYLSEMPINLDIFTVFSLNIATLGLILLMLLLPSHLISRIDPVKSIKFN